MIDLSKLRPGDRIEVKLLERVRIGIVTRVWPAHVSVRLSGPPGSVRVGAKNIIKVRMEPVKRPAADLAGVVVVGAKG